MKHCEEVRMRKRNTKHVFLFFPIFFLSLCFLFSQTEEVPDFLAQCGEGVISYIVYGENKDVLCRGTGFLLNESVMVTAYHSLRNAASVEGVNYKGKKVKVEGVVGVDKNLDIILLKINRKDPPLILGNSDELEQGKRIFALGSNESGEITLSEGLVRGFLEISPTQRVADTSLAVPETFNGGPVVSIENKVMGILIFLDPRTKFLLPVNLIKSLKPSAVASKLKDMEKEEYFSTLEGAFLAGRIFALLDETGKAQKYLEDVISKDPANIEAHALLASVYMKQRNYESAASSFKKVIELNPKRDDAYQGLGMVLLKLRRFEEAVSALEKAVELNIDNREVYYHIGNAYEELEDWGKAAEAYEKYLSLKPQDPWTGNLRLGLCRMNLQDYEKAVIAFENARKEKPDDIKTNYNLAQAYHKAGKLEEAQKTYEHLAEINPEDANVYYNTILRMYDEVGMSEKSIEAAKKVIELNPKSEMAIYNLGIMLMKLERYDEAIDAFKKAIEIRPDYDSAYYNIGFAYSKQKKYKESIEAFEKFVEISPDSADGWFNIGVGYMLLKKFNEALEPLEKCVELRPDYAVAYYNLAITYLNLQDYISARNVYEKLVTLDPDLAERLRKLLR